MPLGQRSIRLGSDEAHLHIPLRKLALENRQHLTLLIKYVKLGNAEQVKELLQVIRTRPNRSQVINGRDRHGHTPLHYAAKLNKVDIVSLLVGAHADVNKRSDDNDKVMPLHYACRWQAPQASEGSIVNLDASVSQTIHLLLQRGAEVNSADSYGMTGLHHACQRGNLDTVVELLKLPGINVDSVDKQVQTPLHMAANKGDTRVVALLLEAGAEVFCPDELGSLPIHLAAREGHVETAKVMARHVTKRQPNSLEALVGAQDGEGGTILHEAVNNGNFEMVKFAFSVSKLDPNAATLNGDTALHLASGKGHLEIVHFLVEEASADVDPVDEAGNSPLHDAARLNREKVLLFLLEKGADIDLANGDGMTPLMKAASWGQSKAVSALLHSGANVTLRDNEDKTVFWHAVKGNHVGAVQVLSQNVKYPMFLELPDQFGNTALHLAASQGSVELCELLIGHSAVVDARNDEERTPLHLACMKGHPETARVLCEKSEDLLEDEDESGNKPLHLAAIKGHSGAVRMLLDLGAAVDGRNSKGWTPLDCAASVGSFTCCQVLLEHDAPVDAKDKRNRTPLHIAAREGHTKIVLLLLDSGADISHCDKTGRNCLDLAIDHQEEEVAEAIVQHERWRDALRNVSRSKLRRKGNRYQNSPLLKLIRRMPDVAQIVFTRCMVESANVQPESVNYKVMMDYEFIDYVQPEEVVQDDDDIAEEEEAEVNDFGDTVETWKDWNPDRGHNHPLLVMVDCNRESLLAHPLVSTLLDYKWNKVIRYSYYLTFALYSIFLAFITALALSTNPERSAYVGNSTTLPDCGTSKENALLFTRIVIIFYCLVRFIGEGVELVLNGASYFNLENLGDWVTHMTAIIFAWEFERDRQCVVTNWQWQVGVVAVWLAWLTFIFNQRRSGILGIYVVMFAHVFTTFLKLLAVIVLFVIAFGLAFFMLFNDFGGVIAYRTPGRALLKTAVSMTGEFEFDTTFNNEDFPLPFPGVSYFLWSCFLVIMPIILMNMLVGLAVDDIKGVQDNARLSQLSMQVRLILSIEAKMPRYVHDTLLGLNIPSYTVSPNEPATIRARMKDYLFEDRLTTDKIQETISPPKSELDRLEEQNKELRDQLKDLIGSVSESHSQVQDMKKLVKAICHHHNISTAAHEN